MVCYLLYRFKPNNIKIILTFYLLCICVIAFLYVPAVEADLYRLIEFMNNYASLPFEDFRALILDKENAATPLSLIYLRIIGLTGVVGLLAATTTFIVFSNIFYIIYDYCKRLYSPNRVVAFSVFVVMGTGMYMWTISGIRSALAFTIIARCIYDEVCNEKKTRNNIIWYIVSCLIHPAAIALVIIRIISIMHAKLSSKNIRPLLATFIYLIIGSIALFYFGGTDYLTSALNLFTKYTAETGYTYFWDNVITILILIFIFVNYWIFYRLKNNIDKPHLEILMKLSYLLTFICIIFYFEISIFTRFTLFNLVIMLPVIMSNYSNVINPAVKTKSMGLAYRLSLVLPVLIFIIYMSRGSLSSLKFFILG